MKYKYKRIERMTKTMRIIHWVNVVAIVAAVVTGLYIAHPYYETYVSDPAVDKYVMAWNRLIHFIGAILVDVTSIWVAYLYVIGDKERPWTKIIPTKRNVTQFKEVILNALTLNRRKKFDTTEMDSFNAVWFAIMHILLAWMLFTGLQLYVHGLASGHSAIGSWWPWMLHAVTDWTIPVCGGTLMDVRIAHHISMWLIVVWVVCHVYVQIWRTIYWQEGDIAIAFGGSKFKKVPDNEE